MDENMDIINDFNNEPEAQEEAPKNAAEEFLNGPFTGVSDKAASPVHVKKNEVIENKIEKASKPKGAFLSKAIQGKKKGGKLLGAATPNLDDMPVPTGGVGLLLFLSLLMVFAITPAFSGTKTTRLSLLWQAVLGNASLGSGGQAAAPPSIGATAPGVPAVVPSINDLIQGGYAT